MADSLANENWQPKLGMEKRNTSKWIDIDHYSPANRFSLRFINFLSLWHRIDESEADKNERLAKWQKYLDNDEAKKEIAERNHQTDEAPPQSEQPDSANNELSESQQWPPRV